jgi:hypothetical protein
MSHKAKTCLYHVSSEGKINIIHLQNYQLETDLSAKEKKQSNSFKKMYNLFKEPPCVLRPIQKRTWFPGACSALSLFIELACRQPAAFLLTLSRCLHLSPPPFSVW